ncbi:hypothetical protein ABZP36_023803 [Zizania latifolia]
MYLAILVLDVLASWHAHPGRPAGMVLSPGTSGDRQESFRTLGEIRHGPNATQAYPNWAQQRVKSKSASMLDALSPLTALVFASAWAGGLSLIAGAGANPNPNPGSTPYRALHLRGITASPARPAACRSSQVRRLAPLRIALFSARLYRSFACSALSVEWRLVESTAGEIAEEL